jgi:hypothetical protein
MNIEIKNKKAAQSITDANNVIWKMFASKFKKGMILQFLFVFIAVVFGFLDFNRYDRITTPGNIRYFNLNLFPSLAILYSVFLSVRIISFFKGKKKFFKNAKEQALRLTYGSDEMTIIINEVKIKYTTASITKEMNWVLFSHYKLYDNILFLYTLDSISLTLEKKKFLIMNSWKS